MARSLDYGAARALLDSAFAAAEADFAGGTGELVPAEMIRATGTLMKSTTQAYREVLVGCCLARILDPVIDVHLPYANQGDTAYNGRSLDEAVVNPFLQQHQVPASRGPFLSVFRRSVQFAPEIRSGLRDKAGFDALLTFIDMLSNADAAAAHACLRHLLTAFVALRDASDIALVHVQRLSLDQYDLLLERLLQVPSGGRFPVLLAVAMFHTLRQSFNLDWAIEWQGINVADRASDVGGDITVRSGEEVILSVEVTERPIDRARVEATFNHKILTHRLTDYLFLHGEIAPAPDARTLARRYFGQGHDMSFLPVRQWLLQSLGTIGTRHRPIFTTETIALLRGPDVPASLKLAWNETVRGLLDG
jgi:hypothetical protein